MTDYKALVDQAREHIEHIARGVPGSQGDRVRRGENDDPRTALVVRLADAVDALQAERDGMTIEERLIDIGEREFNAGIRHRGVRRYRKEQRRVSSWVEGEVGRD